MLAEGMPDAVLAFWDGESRGTADMIARARKEWIPVRVVEDFGAVESILQRGSRRQSRPASPSATLPTLEDSIPLVDLPEAEFEAFFDALLREECE
jgi:hypothetical protein